MRRVPHPDLVLWKTTINEVLNYTFYHGGVILELPTRWVRSIADGVRYSSQTIGHYANAVKDFLGWIIDEEQYSQYPVDDVLKVISRKGVQDWIMARKTVGIQATTLRNREAAVKKMFDWLTSADGRHIRTTDNTPYKTDKLISRAPTTRSPRYLPSEELIILLNGFHNEGERCLAQTLFDTGLRISEAIRLRKKDLPEERHFPQGTKYLPLSIKGSKGRANQYKERITIISSPVLARIRQYHNSSSYRFSPFYDIADSEKPVFLSVNGRPLSARVVNKQIKRAAERVGLDPIRFSAHKLRHGAAYAILTSEFGKDYLDKLVLVQHLFGHASPRTTEAYTAVPPAILSKLSGDKVVVEKYQEAKRIRDATFLAPLKHNEKRGHLSRTALKRGLQ